MPKLPVVAVSFAASLFVGASALAEHAQEGDTDAVSAVEIVGSTNCLMLRQVRDSDPVDDYTIVFEMRGGDVYRNRTTSKCSGLKKEGRFSFRTPQNRICKGDILSVIDVFGNFRGSCSLGNFEKLAQSN